MGNDGHEARVAMHELLKAVSDLDAQLFDDPGAMDEQSALEGMKWIFTILQIAMDVHVHADDASPHFVDIAGPGTNKKWGGDNSDAYYQYALIDGARTYRVSGTRGDAVYLSLTVYGGPKDGRYSDRIVGIVNDRQLDIADDGSFEIILSPDPHPGNWLKLESDAVAALTRDYMNDAQRGRRAEWRIEALDRPARRRETDADLARRFRAATTWVRDQGTLRGIAGEPNTISDPYPVPKVTHGWAAGDASYAIGGFDLAPDEALVIDGTSPPCAFWNLCLWNPFMQTFNYDYERVTINGTQIVGNADGSWRIVIAHEDPGHPNWVSTAGHQRGRIFFRWFLAESVPDPLHTQVVNLDQVGSAGTPAR